MNHTITIPQSPAQDQSETQFKMLHCNLCALAELKQCQCVQLQTNFTPCNPAGIIFKGLLANNPNNPGISIKEGAVSYLDIESIRLSEVGKVKLCLRNDYMLINTLQIYNAQGNNKPICFGVDPTEASLWLLAVIQAKLILSFQINIGNERPQKETVDGILFKRSVMGKWKQLQASCCTLFPNKYLKLSDEYTSLSSTSEIWTRFQRVEIKGIQCLILKLWGTLGKKQIAVPFGQLALWVRAICSLLN